MVDLRVVGFSVDFEFGDEVEFCFCQRFDVNGMVLHEMKEPQVWGVNPLNGLEAGNFEIFEIKDLEAGK